MSGVNALLLRTIVITGLIIGVLNIVFAALEYGLSTLPIWFYLAQLLLLPAMFIPLRFFPQAAVTREFLNRAALYGLGWAVPYAIYKFSHDVLNPAFSAGASLTGYLLTVTLFALIFAAIRRPK